MTTGHRAGVLRALHRLRRSPGLQEADGSVHSESDSATTPVKKEGTQCECAGLKGVSTNYRGQRAPRPWKNWPTHLNQVIREDVVSNGTKQHDSLLRQRPRTRMT